MCCGTEPNQTLRGFDSVLIPVACAPRQHAVSSHRGEMSELQPLRSESQRDFVHLLLVL
jgi:hypothetical protein